MSRTQRCALCALVLLCSLLVARTVSAHTEVESGSYILEIGWMNEPVLVNEPNGLNLFIRPMVVEGADELAEGDDLHDEGVTGAEASLTFTVEYGAVRRTFDLRPVADQPGLYTTDILPTREGQYTFIFGGSINGEAVDVNFEPEEVETAGSLAFPEEPLSAADLATQLAGVQRTADAARTMADIGIVAGLVAIGLGLFGLLRKR